MAPLFLRYAVATALAAATGYGAMRFRGSALRSPNYVTRPNARGWSLSRFLRDEEWTSAGLEYRKKMVRWWVTCLVLVLLFAAAFSD